MPARHDLPESLAGLARRNALPIRHESFRSDAGRLITAIERILAAHPAPPRSQRPGAHGVRPAGNAVGEVAHTRSGPARDDPARAARLLADAERIASSITDESSKASALSGIAQALAATDPDRAERIASSITSESCEGRGAERHRAGTGGHRPRPRRTHRQLHHRQVLRRQGR